MSKKSKIRHKHRKTPEMSYKLQSSCVAQQKPDIFQTSHKPSVSMSEKDGGMIAAGFLKEAAHGVEIHSKC